MILFDVPHHIDQPESGEIYFAERVMVSGWIYLGDRQSELNSVTVCCNGKNCGETRLFIDREDVRMALSLPDGVLTGFRLLCAMPPAGEGNEKVLLFFKASLQRESGKDNQVEEIIFAEIEVALAPVRLSLRPYAQLVGPSSNAIPHRENIYLSGAPSAIANEECLILIRNYLDSAQSVLDVGCGIGAYGRRLIEAGYEWTGVEVSPSNLDELDRLGLPSKKVNEGILPFPDASFDNVICIEVLEHIEDIPGFLEEIARVVRKRALFSVPNMEVVPMMYPTGTVPWHLLEGTHLNFFNRYTLKRILSKYFEQVEVIDYGELPVRSTEGCKLFNHLLAIADHPRKK